MTGRLIGLLGVLSACTGKPVLGPMNSGDSADSGELQEPEDSGEGGSSDLDGCPGASALDGAEVLFLGHKEWGEVSEWLVDNGETYEERSLQEFDTRESWEEWLDARGLYDPLPDVDLESNDLVFIHQLDHGCISATWTFDEAYVHDGSRVVVGTHDRPPEDPDNSCEDTWVDVHLLTVGEAEPDVELCLDEAEYGGPRGG